MSKPLVSVVMITYDHENYIKQSIEGVLMQLCDFEIELIIANDCSPDNTDEVVKNFIETHPKANLVKYTRHDSNKGVVPNFLWALSQSQGNYIALCEGDDYWTDDKKLQKQVEFLTDNYNYVMCFHDALKLDEIGTAKTGERMINSDTSFEVSAEDLLIKNRANTLTVMFRNGIIKNYPDWMYTFNAADRFLYLLLSEYGKIIYLPFVGATYRLHQLGVSNFKRQPVDSQVMIAHYKTRIKANQVLNTHFKYKHDTLISKIIKDYAILLFELYFSVLDYSNCKKVVSQYNLKLLSRINYKYILKFLYVIPRKSKDNKH